MIPTLETARLTLRAPRLEDFEPYAAFFTSDRSIYQDGPLDRARAWKEFATVVGQWALRGYGALGLKTLVSYIDADNAPSIRLAERLGATRDDDAPLPENERCLVYRHPGPEAMQ